MTYAGDLDWASGHDKPREGRPAERGGLDRLIPPHDPTISRFGAAKRGNMLVGSLKVILGQSLRVLGM
jgi:hypothetical protein